MIRLFVGLLVCLFAMPAQAGTSVWLFYGWGNPGWSSGIDEIAMRARRIRGVTAVHVHEYTQTQMAYDEIRASPADEQIVLGGYSCGSNAALVVGQSLNGQRTVNLALIQPSIWCGRYPTTANESYVQDTYSYRTAGLGAYQPQGDAPHVVFIERPDMHSQADTDVNAQRDVLFVISAVANPAHRKWLVNHLGRTTTFKRYNGQVLRLGPQ